MHKASRPQKSSLFLILVIDSSNLHSGDDPQTGCLDDGLFDCGDRHSDHRGDRRRDSRLVYSPLATGRGDWSRRPVAAIVAPRVNNTLVAVVVVVVAA